MIELSTETLISIDNFMRRDLTRVIKIHNNDSSKIKATVFINIRKPFSIFLSVFMLALFNILLLIISITQHFFIKIFNQL